MFNTLECQHDHSTLYNTHRLITNSVSPTRESAYNNKHNRMKNLRNVIIPDTVTKIDYYAFGGCSLIETITLPSSITSLGQVFLDVPQLKLLRFRQV